MGIPKFKMVRGYTGNRVSGIQVYPNEIQMGIPKQVGGLLHTKGCYINMLRVRGPKQKIEPHETECVGHMYAISAEITVFRFYSFSKHRVGLMSTPSVLLGPIIINTTKCIGMCQTHGKVQGLTL